MTKNVKGQWWSTFTVVDGSWPTRVSQHTPPLHERFSSWHYEYRAILFKPFSTFDFDVFTFRHLWQPLGVHNEKTSVGNSCHINRVSFNFFSLIEDNWLPTRKGQISSVLVIALLQKTRFRLRFKIVTTLCATFSITPQSCSSIPIKSFCLVPIFLKAGIELQVLRFIS